ncbi:putative N-6 DNA methylase family [Candidatus Nitrososphaera gargensis Ga9.2]|uniref:site-specific DNA-methyltransferase (adenine-specific) n=1 Tax=Nitrososphaera gargensis (strain Ga9.2) TaxID=1237085 RepID=K0IJB6_NITGG|nr:N-6 DNA methylase [Candidatus Nitrososphaera gargensis]AFU59198.1 putative N-6 DNA methylase family [Candidatus Nitrososphaera gargensis Ga9.2]
MALTGRMGENTCNAILTEQLNKKGLRASFERHFTTLEGIKKPDIFIESDGYYFIEGKQSPQAQLIHAVSKAHIYKETIKSNIRAKGVFAVVYPQKCEGPCEAAILLDRPPYYIEYRAESLENLSDWIKAFVERPEAPREINTADAIRLLNQAVDSMVYSFTKLEISEINDIFGGKTFFESVLGYEQEKDVPKQHLRTAAAYLLVNQIMFYQVLARETNDYDVLDSEKITKPAELKNTYFAKVLLKDYKPIFDFDIASKLKDEESLEAIKTTINVVNALSPEKHGHDILGKIFHNLIPLDIRKVVAAYFTKSEAGDLLANLSIDSANSTVIDPACGSGTLLVSSYRRKKDLILADGEQFTAKVHRAFAEQQITGVDIMPFAAHLAAVHIALQSPLYYTDNLRIAIHDSTGLTPGETIDAAQQTLKEYFKTGKITDYIGENIDTSSRKIVKGVVKMAETPTKPMEIEKVDVVIMNPPFTSQTRIPSDYKRSLDRKFVDYQKYSHGQLGLHGYFIFLGDKLLDKNGKLAMVLPATILRLQSTEGVRKLLFNNYHVSHIITTMQKAAFSENASFREILLIATKGKHFKQDENVTRLKNKICAVVSLREIPRSSDDAVKVARAIRARTAKMKAGDLVTTDLFTIKTIDQEELQGLTKNAFVLMAFSDWKVSDIWLQIVKVGKPKMDNLENCLANVKGGIVRGIEIESKDEVSVLSTFISRTEERALKSGDVWVLKKEKLNSVLAENKVTHVQVEIPKKVLKFGIRRLTGISTIDITDKLDFVVIDKFEDIDSFFGHQFKSFAKLDKWRRYVESRVANLTVNRRFNISAPGTNLLSFFTSEDATPAKIMWCIQNIRINDAKILCLWFNSTINIIQVLAQRSETEGAFLELSEYMLAEFSVLDPSKLREAEREELIKVFDEIKKSELPSILEQLKNEHPARQKIDRTILKVLGFNGRQIDEILAYLYPALTKEITRLKSLMGA